MDDIEKKIEERRMENAKRFCRYWDTERDDKRLIGTVVDILKEIDDYGKDYEVFLLKKEDSTLIKVSSRRKSLLDQLIELEIKQNQ